MKYDEEEVEGGTRISDYCNGSLDYLVSTETSTFLQHCINLLWHTVTQ